MIILNEKLFDIFFHLKHLFMTCYFGLAHADLHSSHHYLVKLVPYTAHASFMLLA